MSSAKAASLLQSAITGSVTTDGELAASSQDALYVQQAIQRRSRESQRATTDAFKLYSTGGQRAWVSDARRQLQSTTTFRQMESQFSRARASVVDESSSATMVPPSVSMSVGNMPERGRRTLQRLVLSELASRGDRDAPSGSVAFGALDTEIVRRVTKNGTPHPYLGNHTALRVGDFVVGGASGVSVGEQTMLPKRKGVRAARRRAMQVAPVRAAKPVAVRAMVPLGPLMADEQPTSLLHGRQSLLNSRSMQGPALRATLQTKQPSADAIRRETARRSPDGPALQPVIGGTGLQQGARDGRPMALPTAVRMIAPSGETVRELELALGVTSEQIPAEGLYRNRHEEMQSALQAIAGGRLASVSTDQLRELAGHLTHLTGLENSQVPEGAPTAYAVQSMTETLSASMQRRADLMPSATDRARMPPAMSV